MKYGKVFTYKDAEEAEKLIGKNVIYDDNFFDIEVYPKNKNILILKNVTPGAAYPFRTSNGNYQFIRDVIEEPELMTKRQLSEWCAKGNGEYTHIDIISAYSSYQYLKEYENIPVPDTTRIRTWDSDEWVVPTVEIYERDCKRDSK